MFIRREDAERFVEEVLGDEPKLASYLRIEERELRRAGLNLTPESSPLLPWTPFLIGWGTGGTRSFELALPAALFWF